ncbi:hypothetical protein AALP_AA2G002000 [Arabis alpina]|uniref:Uncharacterized protein n=1 Tax=Arabis alpina TaxID=50452 RepID=A0A087HED3_ARAAL|nr:hypothetical protein AALP_AA2G002000 [Arabis alpina]
MAFCKNLQIVPTHLNLASLDLVNMMGCLKLRKIPEISTYITQLAIGDTMLEELPGLWSGLKDLRIFGIHPTGLNIEKLPDWIKDLHGLKSLRIHHCLKIATLPELPSSLTRLTVEDCESLETLMVFPSDSQIEELYFLNCFKLTSAARRVITLQAILACLPGRTMPADCLIRFNGCSIEGEFVYPVVYGPRTEHLFISYAGFLEKDGWLEQDNEVSFEFSTSSMDIDVIECGVRILTDLGSISRENCLRLLIGEAYPSKCLPPTFHTEYLVQLNMQGSQLEHLWQGTQRLVNLKKMNLYGSLALKELPDLSHATNLERLNLTGCSKLTSLPELPGSLIVLLAEDCESLEAVVCPLNTPKAHLNFSNCNKLSQQTRRGIIRPQTFRYTSAILPGRQVPAEFDHRGSATTGPFSASSRYRCGVILW